MRRRVTSGLALGAAVLLAVAACGSDDSPASDGGGSGGGGGGGNLTIGFDNEPPDLDPILSSRISSDRHLLNAFFDTLIRQERNGEFVPALAESWESDESSVTFTLRDDVTFHDGTPFDADAVVVNLDRARDDDSGSVKAAGLGSIDGVTAVDEHTVRLDLNRTDPLLFVNLAHEAGMMGSPAAIETDAEGFGRAPVGTGPFVFDSWRTNATLTASANEDYWRTDADGESLPKLDGLTVRFITDPSTLRTELQTGGVDMVRVLPPEEFTQLADNPDITIEDVGLRRSYYMTLNATRPPFDDPAIREAVAMAVDRDAIGRAAAGDEFDLAPSFAVEGDWFYDGDITPPELDPAGAHDILESAGLLGTEITIVARNRQPDPMIAELLQAQLGEAGFSVQVEPLEAETQLSRMREKDFDAGILVIDVPRLDPSLSFDPYFTTDAPNNWSGVQDEELDRLLTDAVATDDQDARAEDYIAVQQRVIDENYWVFLYQPRNPLNRRSNVEGIALDVDGQWRLDEAYLAE
ncbi:ABC transporter substrate-binding protein [Phytoactinopolyspora endophytica]|uniref:ABC transporter substrate-binding protein n=1 Tax=Phytoactinopolyspora endophytica TaxID=1642495 RepID=UPI0013EDCC85|nr:ABC transporter substrate-binding protein [Phytoactinopolyspora endophytica]